jgi:predicted ABC-type sugar transport system permease subunit
VRDHGRTGTTRVAFGITAIDQRRPHATALMIGLINNGLILMGLEYSQQLIARGVIILLAVAVAGRNR